MAVYRGPPIESGAIALVEPDEVRLLAALSSADLPEPEKDWFSRAQAGTDLLYFSVTLGAKPIGQVMLHDIDERAHEAMVGYHIFDAERRGEGYGRAALEALCRHAFQELGLARLLMMTELGNTASRRIAEKCGFRDIGPAREGPHLVVYERR